MKQIEYKTHSGEVYHVVYNDYNKGIIDTLLQIGQKEGWEEAQDEYFKEIYKGLI